MDKKIQATLLFVLAVFIFMVGSKYGTKILNSNEEPAMEIVAPTTENIVSNSENSPKADSTQKENKEIYVHVSGAVKNPGLYKLSSESRVNDALEVATPLAKADINQLNLAQKLGDGQKVIVPAKGEKINLLEQAAGQAAGQTQGMGGAKININTATTQELDTLPGIGPAYAERIIQYRTEHGPFLKLEDVQEVQGIGPKMFENMKERISVD